MRSLLKPLILLSCLAVPAAAQELRGHGGPVRAIAVAPDGASAMTGSFDQSAILWSLSGGTAEAVLRFHDGAVNAVAAVPGLGFATGAEDGRIALWRGAAAVPAEIIEGHKGPVAALAVSADGRRIASASWDGTARVTARGGGAAVAFEGHQGPVNGVAFLPGGGLVTAGYDATLRIWPADAGAPRIVTLSAPLNGVVVAADGEIAVAAADGRLRLFGPDGEARGEVTVGETPLIALALSSDGTTLAAGGLRGQVALIDRAARRIRATLVGPGLPVWSLAFLPDGRQILSGGADRLVRRWNAVTGEHIGTVVPRAGADVLAAFNGVRGAQVFRACAACHTLTPSDGNRAGPTLHGIFGRRIASAPGYAYSEAFKTMDIVWTKETVAKLFEIGPNAYTPGTKMPEQTIGSAEDRQALVDWLEKVTR
ncbi:MAG: c-type cytochrome [Bosea sp. (in: a-proteobacteria)]|uniref:c-type cytochrome n=1 Tax=Bosea sp. (in: a-proteobacteria) TaxID=1871050 RepID=UPI0027372951|nr:c-type cytochrome [Bosea sp. (in: a-proteobacteria)]MDP3256086.1 c-type cytochrome [Bosea sp. (in: a-proteobacteria)]MDP3321819.1 c-type cytochrome [Bosea sp. (in: a-proteobacteria)]